MHYSSLLITCSALAGSAYAGFPPQPEGIITQEVSNRPGVSISYKEVDLYALYSFLSANGYRPPFARPRPKDTLAMCTCPHRKRTRRTTHRSSSGISKRGTTLNTHLRRYTSLVDQGSRQCLGRQSQEVLARSYVTATARKAIPGLGRTTSTCSMSTNLSV